MSGMFNTKSRQLLKLL